MKEASRGHTPDTPPPRGLEALRAGSSDDSQPTLSCPSQQSAMAAILGSFLLATTEKAFAPAAAILDLSRNMAAGAVTSVLGPLHNLLPDVVQRTARELLLTLLAFSFTFSSSTDWQGAVNYLRNLPLGDSSVFRMYNDRGANRQVPVEALLGGLREGHQHEPEEQEKGAALGQSLQTSRQDSR